MGDSITIVIEEKTSASKKSSATANRAGSTDLKVPVVSGVPFRTFQGLDVEATSSTNFAGGGDASSNNLFQGYINEAQTMGWLSRVFNVIWPF